MTLCNLDLCRTLQEIGYDGHYPGWIDRDDGTIMTGSYDLYSWHIPCPRLDDVADWLRDRHGLHITVDYNAAARRWIARTYDIHGTSERSTAYTNLYLSHDLALEAAVTQTIHRLKPHDQ